MCVNSCNVPALSARVPVERLRTGNGREGRVTKEMRGLEQPPGALRLAAFLQARSLVLPTEWETGRSRPPPIQPHESSSLVSPLPKSFRWIRAVFFFEPLHLAWFGNVVPNILLGNTSPRAISRAERERKVSMRLHRGAPANVSSSDLTARHDQSRISTSQVKMEADEPTLSVIKLRTNNVTQKALWCFIFRSACHLSTWGSRVLWLSSFTKLTGNLTHQNAGMMPHLIVMENKMIFTLSFCLSLQGWKVNLPLQVFPQIFTFF